MSAHPLFSRPEDGWQIHWDDLPVGTCFQTASRTITESDVVAFAALSADFNRIHVDAEHARSSPFGQRIAHGLLVAAVMSGLATRTVANQWMEPSVLGLLETQMRFPKPTFIGDTLSVAIEVLEQKTTSRPERGIVVFGRRARNQRGEVVAEVQVTMLMQRRPAG